MSVTWRALSGRHQARVMCARIEERSWKRWQEEEAWRRTGEDFQVYLGRRMTSSDDNWSAVVVNLRKVRRWWVRMSKILGW